MSGKLTRNITIPAFSERVFYAEALFLKSLQMSQQREKNVRAKDVFYELRSINLASLSDDEGESVLGRFSRFLDSLNDPIAFRIIEDSRDVRAGNAIWPDMKYKRHFISSRVEIDAAVSMIGTKWVRVPVIPELELIHAGDRYLVDEDSHFIQIFDITSLGGKIAAGFLGAAMSISQEVRVELQPIEPLKAKKLIGDHYYELSRSIATSRVVGGTLMTEFERTKAVRDVISSGIERLFRARMNVVLRAADFEELKKKRKALWHIMGGIVEDMSSPKWLQLPLYTGIGPRWSAGRWFFVPTSTALAFFPFSGLDIVDPNGTFVGLNNETGNAIIYDLYEKDNFNVSIAGESGGGKSTFIKAFVSRLAIENPDVKIYCFDAIRDPEYSKGPDGSYETSFAGFTGSYVHCIERNAEAGLDPFGIFRDRRDVARFLAGLLNPYKISDFMTDLNEACDVSKSIEELISNASSGLRKQLISDLKPYMKLFSGERIQILPRMVFRMTDLSDWQKDMVMSLTFYYVWEKIKAMPRSEKKVLIIDEGWTLFGSEGRNLVVAGKFVEEIARQGRHHNVMFILATQRISDFLNGDEKSPGKVMIDLCETKFILKHEPTDADVLMENLKITEEERRYIVDASPGYGLLLTRDGRAKFYNLLNEYERKYYTTRPKEVTA
jgi:hypothetical protein